jgi:prolyl-tRNA synthetase
MTSLFFRTLKEPPADSEIISHKLLEQAGYLHKLGKGLYIYTPLMWRVLKKMMTIIREELDRAGCQELACPILQPKELWEKSGRWDGYVAERLLYTLKDREDREFCIAPTHEEVVTSLVADWIKSHKKLPLNLYQFGSKFRDEIRPRFGLMRGKEFLMKDGYSFAASEQGMNDHYERMHRSYSAIFTRFGLDFSVVKAHGGKIGQGRSEEFQVKADAGEDAIMVAGSFACNIETAHTTPTPFSYETTLQKKELLSTPNLKSIEQLSENLALPKERILKMVVYTLTYADCKQYVAILIRGDRQINPVKVQTELGALEIALATNEEILAQTKTEPGFLGPIDCPLPIYADLSCVPMTNVLCGANKKDAHFINVNFERDFPKPEFKDFLLAEEGDPCPEAGGLPYKVQRGIEVAHIFNLGTTYSKKCNGQFQDEQGAMHYFWMGTYGIGVSRTAAAIVEQSHDTKGIVWPISIAPFTCLITAVSTKDPLLTEAALRAYDTLLKAGYDVLLDDRDERLGFKLHDSDLMGIPYKMIFGKSYLQEKKVEIESRAGEKNLIEEQDLLKWTASISSNSPYTSA